MPASRPRCLSSTVLSYRRRTAQHVQRGRGGARGKRGTGLGFVVLRLPNGHRTAPLWCGVATWHGLRWLRCDVWWASLEHPNAPPRLRRDDQSTWRGELPGKDAGDPKMSWGNLGWRCRLVGDHPALLDLLPRAAFDLAEQLAGTSMTLRNLKPSLVCSFTPALRRQGHSCIPQKRRHGRGGAVCPSGRELCIGHPRGCALDKTRACLSRCVLHPASEG